MQCLTPGIAWQPTDRMADGELWCLLTSQVRRMPCVCQGDGPLASRWSLVPVVQWVRLRLVDFRVAAFPKYPWEGSFVDGTGHLPPIGKPVPRRYTCKTDTW
jgi:hypothetical protein